MNIIVYIIGFVLYIFFGLVTAALVDRFTSSEKDRPSRWEEDDRKLRITACFIGWPFIAVIAILIGLILGIFWFLTNIGNMLIKAVDKINGLINRILNKTKKEKNVISR